MFPERWLAAVGATVALWVIAHTAGLFWFRRRLERRMDLTDRERWAAYHTLQRKLSIATLAAVYVTIFALQPVRALALAGATAALANLILLVIPFTILQLAAAPISIPLRLRALPVERRTSILALSLRELRRACSSLLGSTLFYWWIATALSGMAPMPPGVEAWLPRVVGTLAGVVFVLWCVQAALLKRPAEAPGIDAARTASISEDFRRLTTALGLPTPAFEFATRFPGYLPENIVRMRHAIRVPSRIASALEPEQTAALIAAFLLRSGLGSEKPVSDGSSCLFWLLGFGATVWLIAALLLHQLSPALAAGVLILLLLGATLLPIYQRRNAAKEAGPDYRVSQQLSDRSLLLLAFETLELRERERLLPEEEAEKLATLRLRIEALRRALDSNDPPAVHPKLEGA